VLMTASCDRPAIDPSESLVGAKQLPTAGVLSREAIQINRGFGSISPGLLSYELRPNNTLIITLTHRDRATFKEVTDGRETFHLPPNMASQARRALWRLRPETLRGLDWVTRPSDCPAPPTDTFPESTVVFIAEGPNLDIDADRIAVVDVPYLSICHARQSVEAHGLVERVLQSLPSSRVAAEYDQRRDRVVVPL
jgi:hypothetical protein